MSEEKNKAKESGSSAAGTQKKLSDDAQNLGPIPVRGVMLGAVDMIVGEGGLEVPEFVVTKQELLELARYWATEITERDFTFFLYGSTGSSEVHSQVFAHRRLNRIRNLIGQDEVAKAFTQAELDFAKRVDQHAWQIFMTGTETEQEDFRNKIQEKVAHAAKERPN